MKYVNAAEVLPERLLRELQAYIDGDALYSQGFLKKGMGNCQRFPHLLQGAQQGDPEAVPGRIFHGSTGRAIWSGAKYHSENYIWIVRAGIGLSVCVSKDVRQEMAGVFFYGKGATFAIVIWVTCIWIMFLLQYTHKEID